MEFTVRPAIPEDEPFLREMLYQAIYVPEGAPPLSKDLIKRPELARYVRGWGRPQDIGFIAEEAILHKPVGAAWSRMLGGEPKGYGYVDDETPELSIAVLPEYCGKGIGSQLLARLLEAAKERFPSVSLSVSPDNPALRLYRRFGFEVVGERGDSLIMQKIFESWFSS